MINGKHLDHMTLPQHAEDLARHIVQHPILAYHLAEVLRREREKGVPADIIFDRSPQLLRERIRNMPYVPAEGQHFVFSAGCEALEREGDEGGVVVYTLEKSGLIRVPGLQEVYSSPSEASNYLIQKGVKEVFTTALFDNQSTYGLLSIFTAQVKRDGNIETLSVRQDIIHPRHHKHLEGQGISIRPDYSKAVDLNLA